MLKPGKFLHIRFFGIESEGTLILLQVCTVTNLGGEFGIFGGEKSPLTALE